MSGISSLLINNVRDKKFKAKKEQSGIEPETSGCIAVLELQSYVLPLNYCSCRKASEIKENIFYLGPDFPPRFNRALSYFGFRLRQKVWYVIS